MQTKTTFKFLGATLISLILSACGGGGGSTLDNTLNGGSVASSSSVSADTLQSLEFTDVTPKVINLKGTGGSESSLVRFRTMGKTGKPLKDIKVNFTLTSTIGGLALTQSSATSDQDGYISTSVNSGTVSTSIRVVAAIDGNATITTQSSELVIATGLPDQKSISIALEKFNPAAWNTNGVTSEVSMLLADAYNNPAPDGTAVYFTTEGGSIQPSCTTLGGGCKVVWTSQSPRPPRNSADTSIEGMLCLGLASTTELRTCQSKRAGRSTILATTVGNESFKDTNGNGIYDFGVDVFRAAPTSPECKANTPLSSFEAPTPGEACDDLAEAYLDSNENDLRESTEHFINFITSTKNDVGTDNYSQANGIYNGSFCREKDEKDGKCSREPISIRREHLIIMSCDSPLLDATGSLPLVSQGTYAVADCNGNAMPVGTTIAIGTNPAITVGNEYDWKPISAPDGAVITIKTPTNKEFKITLPSTTSEVRLGSGSGLNFVPTKLDLGANASTLFTDQTTTISVNIVNDSGNAIQTPIAVTFTSDCIAAGTSSITGGNVVNSIGGTAKAEYKAGSCFGDDIVKASVNYGGKIISAFATIPRINNIRLGVGGGTNFIPTKLDLGANYQALFADQTTTLSVDIVDDKGNPIQTLIPVTFTSDCISAGTSSITGGNVINSTSGSAKVEYKAGSCFGDDVVKAYVNYAGNVIIASATIPQVNNKRIGSGSGGTFTPGQLTSSSSTTLFEGDTTQITANIVTNQSNLITQPTTVIFDSPCLSAGLSTIVGGNIVSSIAGIARIQYKVGKCDIDDVVTATIANGNGNIDASVTLPIDTRRIGSGFDSDFVEHNLELGIGAGLLSPGGSTTVTAYIVNSKGDLVTDPMNVTFTSPCLSAGNSVIAGGNTVTSVNGKAIATYTSQGCAGVGGIDAIKASATFRNTVLSAAADLAVKSDTAQTISFIDATPTLVSIKGTGGIETSVLRFRVLGQGGSPLKGVCVNFAPSTTVGGLALVPSKCNPAGPETYGSSTDSNGYASTTVQAGTVATAVRVTATTANGLSTQSSALAVTTGIPDQNSTSLSLSDLEPAAWKHDGVKSTATIRLADAFNNPAPNGTAVTFTASGGAIDGSCTTVGGTCSVEWRSQNPRPNPAATVSFSGIQEPSAVNKGYTMTCSDGSVECRKGRIQILATAIGNESFVDGNGNGLYDDISTDIFTNSNGVYTSATKGLPLTNSLLCSPNAPHSSGAYGTTNSCDDLREAYVDKNFNSDRDSIEEFVDFNQNGSFDLLPNGKYDGALCSGAAKANGDCTTNKVTVREEATLIMSCENPYQPIGFNSFSLAAGQSIRIPIFLADCNGNALPAGTTVVAVTTGLVNATATVSLSGGLAMSTEPTVIVLTVKADELNTPKGNVGIVINASGLLSTPFSVKVN